MPKTDELPGLGMHTCSSTLTALLLILSSVSCSPVETVRSPAAAERHALAAELRTSLETDLFDRWYPLAVDTTHGGFLSRFARDWQPVPPQDKMIVTQARHVWTTAEAAHFFPEKREAYLAMAAQGVTFLREHLWDPVHGGFHTMVSQEGSLLPQESGYMAGKNAYGNAFAIYGLAAYYKVSGDTEALDLARRTFDWLETHAHDPEHGGYFQFLQADGTPLTQGLGRFPPKDQNSSIHLLEAFTELYRVWPDPLLRERLQEMLLLIRDRMIHERGYLHLFFQQDWTPLSYRDSTEAVRQANVNLDHVSFGHDVETAYLMIDAAEALGMDPAETIQAGKRMVDHALAHAWDHERGGLFDGGYYFDPDGVPEIVIRTKVWWSQAETMNTMLLMADLFPEDERRYFDLFQQMWAYIQAYLIDPVHGGWYTAGLDLEPRRQSDPKGSIWKAAYHDGRSLMNCIRWLEP